MSYFLMIGIGSSLAMDAFAVSLGNGMAANRMSWVKVLQISSAFGLMQALMPTIGYFLGKSFSTYLMSIGPFITFALLAGIGIKMIADSYDTYKNNDNPQGNICGKQLLIQSFATSIDALCVGVGFSVLDINITKAVTVIGIVTFVICAVGVIIGKKVGSYLHSKSGFFGGVVLILIGGKILLEHLL